MIRRSQRGRRAASADALRAALVETHRRYLRIVNFCAGWRGYRWQGRFASCLMDEAHALMAARYIELNPMRAHLTGRQDGDRAAARGDDRSTARPAQARRSSQRPAGIA